MKNAGGNWDAGYLCSGSLSCIGKTLILFKYAFEQKPSHKSHLARLY